MNAASGGGGNQIMEGAEMDERGQPVGSNSIEDAMIAGLEKEFEPRGDLPVI